MFHVGCQTMQSVLLFVHDQSLTLFKSTIYPMYFYRWSNSLRRSKCSCARDSKPCSSLVSKVVFCKALSADVCLFVHFVGCLQNAGNGTDLLFLNFIASFYGDVSSYLVSGLLTLFCHILPFLIFPCHREKEAGRHHRKAENPRRESG